MQDLLICMMTRGVDRSTIHPRLRPEDAHTHNHTTNQEVQLSNTISQESYLRPQIFSLTLISSTIIASLS